MDYSKAILTVCIPTYNRAEILATVQAILPQLTSTVKVKIFDNASDNPVSEILRDYATESIEIIRNPVNVGAAGNIIKCFEYCETEWMWLLSDDDFPTADAIKNILDTIRKHPDVVYVKYNSNLGKLEEKFTKEVISTGQKEFIYNTENFCNLLFISSTLCKPKEIRRGIKAAYYFTHTFSPHIAFLLSYLAINPQAKTLFSPLEIVKWDTPIHDSTWSFDVVNKSLSDFIYTVQGAEERGVFFNKINLYAPYNGPFAAMGIKEVIRILILSKGSENEHDMIADFFSSSSFIYWAKQLPTNSFLFKLFMISVAMLVLRAPVINDIAKSFVKNTSINKQYYYNRFSFFNRDYRL